MTNHFRLKQYCALGVLSALSLNVTASPWLDAGDMQLRHELQILADEGLLDAPLTTWPLASKDIHRSLEKNVGDKSKLSPQIMNVLGSINQRLAEEDYGSGFKVEAKARTKTQLIRDFSGEGREKASVSYDGHWGNSMADVRLKATIADKSDHPSDKNFRLDESYIASSLGNWKFTVGQQSRWWGPSWDGSLILSNNARPIPSISVENVSSKAFGNKWLNWLGPNKLHMFIGQLEPNRKVPNTKLLGARFTFKPYNSLEIGLSRSILWGGDGQEESLSNFFEALVPLNKNSIDDLIVGEQMAGADVRWKVPIKGSNKKYALYGQYLGDDKAIDSSFALGDEIFLLGAEVFGFSSLFDGSWRSYVELVDTSAGSFKGRERDSRVYNHNTYTDGYRYLDLSMGHGIDSNSRLVSTGVMISQKNGDFWRGWIKSADIKVDGVGINPIGGPEGKKWSAIGVSVDKKLNKQSKLNLGLQFTSEKEPNKSRNNDFGASIGYSIAF